METWEPTKTIVAIVEIVRALKHLNTKAAQPFVKLSLGDEVQKRYIIPTDMRISRSCIRSC